MEPIFYPKRYSVILSFYIPWILGIGRKTPEEAKKYIKYGETLNPYYFPVLQEKIKEDGKESVYKQYMQRLFNTNNIDDKLTKIIGEKVYKPWDCLSSIYQIEINEKMALLARPSGVTKNNECIIMVDTFNDNYTSNTEEELKIKLLSTMAVWKTKKGVYIIEKMNDKKISINFDNAKWEDILCKIKLWSEKVV
jgi:hypothetical protein